VLFICSGNSARSIFAEALLRDLGRAVPGPFRRHRPGTALNPFALDVLRRNGHDVGGLRPSTCRNSSSPAPR
jgi:ArsR family transcriptional regulator, arsenate/arsenite/antimonite-responsive transcriptional repressor / arsenate reductase (thioredoxin)